MIQPTTSVFKSPLVPLPPLSASPAAAIMFVVSVGKQKASYAKWLISRDQSDLRERRDETASATAGRAFNPTASTQRTGTEPATQTMKLVSVHGERKLRTLVYDILPSTTAVFCYAIGSRKLSANEQFFVGAQTAVRLLQTAQIISDVYFITDHVVYASSDKTKIVWIETELSFFSFFDPGWMRLWR